MTKGRERILSGQTALRTWEAYVARDADTIEADIERARDGLALAVDELSTRLDPKRAIDKGKRTVNNIWADPKVKAVVIGVGALVTYLMVRKIFR